MISETCDSTKTDIIFTSFTLTKKETTYAKDRAVAPEYDGSPSLDRLIAVQI